MALARAVAPVFAAIPGVAAVALTGSVARGWADRYSDIEIAVFWHHAPTEVARRSIAGRLAGVDWRAFAFDDLGTAEWSEEYLVRGIKLDVLHRTLEATDHLLADVLERYDLALPKQMALAALQDAVPLAGDALLLAWGERLRAYPDALAVAMVCQHLQFGPRQWLEMLAERDDILLLHEIAVAATRNLFSALVGLNRRYHPGEKWFHRTAVLLPVAPAQFGARVRRVLTDEPQASVAELHRLIDETVALVERHMPEIDTAPVKRRLDQRRSLVE